MRAVSRNFKNLERNANGRARKRQALLVNHQDGDGSRRHPVSGETAAAAVRRGRARFLPSFAKLKDVVGTACDAEDRWEAKVVSGIHAVLDFAATDPQAAHALTVDARRRVVLEADLEEEVISYFAALLRDVAAVERPFAISTEEALVEAIATVVRGHLQLGTAEQLSERASDLIYLTLMPYLGISGARRWASTR